MTTQQLLQAAKRRRILRKRKLRKIKSAIEKNAWSDSTKAKAAYTAVNTFGKFAGGFGQSLLDKDNPGIQKIKEIDQQVVKSIDDFIQYMHDQTKHVIEIGRKAGLSHGVTF